MVPCFIWIVLAKLLEFLFGGSFRLNLFVFSVRKSCIALVFWVYSIEFFWWSSILCVGGVLVLQHSALEDSLSCFFSIFLFNKFYCFLFKKYLILIYLHLYLCRCMYIFCVWLVRNHKKSEKINLRNHW